MYYLESVSLYKVWSAISTDERLYILPIGKNGFLANMQFLLQSSINNLSVKS